MSRSKRIFLTFAGVFFAGLIYLVYDISSRTTFPGSKIQPAEPAIQQDLRADTIKKDTSKAVYR